MPGLLVLHIVSVVCWCAAQLYLPALIAARSPHSLPRFVFTRISTPAALLTIVSGTAIFILSRTLEVWLMVKLGLVAALVITHALSGWLLLRAEVKPGPGIVLASGVLGSVLAVLMTGIIWVVLAKPLSALLP